MLRLFCHLGSRPPRIDFSDFLVPSSRSSETIAFASSSSISLSGLGKSVIMQNPICIAHLYDIVYMLPEHTLLSNMHTQSRLWDNLTTCISAIRCLVLGSLLVSYRHLLWFFPIRILKQRSAMWAKDIFSCTTAIPFMPAIRAYSFCHNSSNRSIS